MRTEALFLDRDGVIDEMVAYQGSEPFDAPQSPEDVVLVDGIADVIKWANKNGVLVIEATNRPEVAKGKMDRATATAIENRVQQLLIKSGARVDKIYNCPHHPHGIVPALTTDCSCHKPKPGLLLQAAKDLRLDLTKSLMIGDGASDVEAGKAAGCRTILLSHDRNLPEKVEAAQKAPADFRVKSCREITPLLERFFVPTPIFP